VQTRFVVTIVLSTSLFWPTVVPNMQAGEVSASVADRGKTTEKADATTPPSAQDIANAKSQGLVWVNLGTRVYQKDGELYGKTKHGKFISEDGAKKEGFHEAKQPATSKKIIHKRQGDQSGIDATIETHSSTPPKP
jgi:hypothetical protein